jgi:hypothetical protein
VDGPENFQSEEPYARLGEFNWLPSRLILKDIFWGEMRLFEMRNELPPDRSGSAFLQWLDSFGYDYKSDDWQISWIPYAELQIDCWDEPMLLVEEHVSTTYALLFGDGEQPFPRQPLLEAGYDEEKMEKLQCPAYACHLTKQPIDRTQGKSRHQLEQLPSDAPVLVTWAVTISDFLGDKRANSFKSLRQYGRDEDLRIITTLS